MNIGDLNSNRVTALGLPLVVVKVRWKIGATGAVSNTDGSAPNVTVTRTGVGAYRIDYPASPGQAFCFAASSEGAAKPASVNTETAGQATVTFSAELSNGAFAYAMLLAPPSSY